MSQIYDFVLLGATGYTGQLCVRYMVDNMPSNVRWAIAGRNKSKLEEVAAQMKVTEAGGALIVLDLSSESEIVNLAKSTRVLVNIIGPYGTTCGSVVFKACAEHGTHYVDGAGEPVWRQEMIEKYEKLAKTSGSKMVITCGWGAVPADISTYLAVTSIRRNFSLPTLEVVGALYDIKGSASGGAVDSISTSIANNSLSRLFAAINIHSISPVKPVGNPNGKRKDGLPKANIFGVQTIDGMGIMATHFHEPVDLPLVGRSWGLYASGDADGTQSYGPNFRFSSRIRWSNALFAWLFRVTVVTLAASMLLPPVRFVVGKLFPPGGGASAEQRRKYQLTYRAISIADTTHSVKPKALVEFHYPGDANDFTAMTMTEAGLLLLNEQSSLSNREGGILTPASLGDDYVRALGRNGVQISVDTLR
ncbi:Lipid droplet localized protein [Metarhizium anisopliae]|nr:Lipid droplet localized protein [Metarhizium anisopliae]